MGHPLDVNRFGVELSDWFFCDNSKECNRAIICSKELRDTEARARALGWHIYHGYSETGKWLDVRLCALCVGTPRSQALPPAHDELPGQLDLLGDIDE